MNGSFDFVTANDRPALLAFSTPGWLETTKAALVELGYKVHTAATHSDFLLRFSQAHYQVVIIEELFGANSLAENLSLTAIQNMPSTQRRHATVLMVGDSFQTFVPLEAYKHSVHAVINSSELFLMKQLVEKAVAENELFLQNFREIQNRILTGGKQH
ncbi:MAG TPA: hypothetical protein VF607_16760 [Verrucomicrobiae bacterium]